MAYLEKHIDELTKQGVLKELRNVESCHASMWKNLDWPRISGQLTRFYRTHHTYSLTKASSAGIKYFSNINGASYFYQFRVDEDTARENLCLMALGRLFVSLGILMGLKLAPSFVQSALEKMMSSHKRCKPFVDDFTTFSTTVDEHLDADLPKTLALCSYYNILLSPKKADILKTSCRILGFKISE